MKIFVIAALLLLLLLLYIIILFGTGREGLKSTVFTLMWTYMNI